MAEIPEPRGEDHAFLQHGTEQGEALELVGDFSDQRLKRGGLGHEIVPGAFERDGHILLAEQEVAARAALGVFHVAEETVERLEHGDGVRDLREVRAHLEDVAVGNGPDEDQREKCAGEAECDAFADGKDHVFRGRLRVVVTAARPSGQTPPRVSVN